MSFSKDSSQNTAHVHRNKIYGLGIHSTGAQSSKIVQQLRQNRLGMSTVNLGFHSRTAHFHIAQKQSIFFKTYKNERLCDSIIKLALSLLEAGNSRYHHMVQELFLARHG